jgi:hypothetical protein
MTDPQWWRWNGAAMMPMRPELAEREFRPDGRYLMQVHHERSYQRHKAYFASLHEAWSSLAHDTDLWPTPEHLRKHALIKTGHFDERLLACDSVEMAQRVAAFVRPLDEYAIIVASGDVVRVWTAKSQSYRAMGRDPFNKSMDDVLDYVAGLLGVPKEVLEAQGEMA